MNLSSYLSDRREALLVCFSGGVLFSVLLFLFGLSGSKLLLLWLFFSGILFFTLSRDFLKQRKGCGICGKRWMLWIRSICLRRWRIRRRTRWSGSISGFFGLRLRI